MTDAARWSLPALIVALLLVCLWSLSVGTVHLTFGDIRSGLFDGASDPNVTMIMRNARLPRLVTALVVGAALAASGLLMQILCRNPLATPSVLGIGNGANLGIVVAILAFPGLGEFTALIASFVGAVGSACVISIIGFSPQNRIDRNRLIVGGAVLAAVEGSLVVAVLFFFGMNNYMLGWTLGRITQVDWAQISVAMPVIVICAALAFLIIGQLDALSLGDTVAASLGVRVGQIQAATLFLIVLLAGASVAAAGPVPYVGLIVPHAFPRSRFRQPRMRLLLSLLGGAVLTAVADVLSRLTSQRQLVPLGIWTMATGAVFFLALSLSRKGHAA
jgi:iron complex transport system permease protein